MSTAEEMAEFVLLWGLIDEEDSIIWWWTDHGHYTAKSAYLPQFRGSYCTFNSKAI
jgi:hypothetical protein